ncbi:hypothetical protein LCGC14_0745310 [marine sediment metagenome]|uniref:Uncharacterized protein n=1 Tax=marine sediment metagenome TaxID=412755 RepID=A0A0F9TCM5_9ZZZZ
MSDITRYSDTIPGTEGNYTWPVRFDKTTGGYLGITQEHDGGEPSERVLLSRRQVSALIAFYQGKRRA